jgi:hypothetical protein
MWTYLQETGALEDPEGEDLAIGYSGFGEGKNNGDAEYIPDVGPIPRGTYFIRGAFTSPDLGPVALPLVPAASNQMFGRSGFFIHGDSLIDPGTASKGCIVLNRKAREALDASNDKLLEVVR